MIRAHAEQLSLHKSEIEKLLAESYGSSKADVWLEAKQRKGMCNYDR